MLLEVDGLDKSWQGGVRQSDYAEELENVDTSDPAVQNVFALYWLNNPGSNISYTGAFDLSGMGSGNDSSENNFTTMNEATTLPVAPPDESSTNSVWVVQELSLEFFRQKLVQHFDILFKMKKIVWPRRNDRQTRTLTQL